MSLVPALAVLNEVFGYPAFRGHQAGVIEHVAGGGDALRAWREAKRSARTKGSPEMLPDAAQALFERLRAWRTEAARRHGVPAYVIFHDVTLREIARARPPSLDALRGIPGVGARKLETYGAEIVGLVEKF
jgi:superfamily II DNA helicase RecQ